MAYATEFEQVPHFGLVEWVLVDGKRIGFLSTTADGYLVARDPNPPHGGNGVDSREAGIRRILQDAGLLHEL